MTLWLVLLVPLTQLLEPPPRFERLDNGLRVVVVEDHTLPLVSVQLWYQVGSAYDPPGEPGLCAITRAILEHRDDAALKLRAAGGRFESRTLRDACYFSTVLPPNFVEYVLGIEAQRMRPLKATAEMIQRGLSAAAWQHADQPDHVHTRQVLAAMFPDHPYQHPPGLVAQPLRHLSTDELDEFLRRWFVPSNATLLVVGDVSTVRALEQVRQRFDELEPADAPRRPQPKRHEAETIRIRAPGRPHSGFTIAWRTPPMGYFENAAIDVLMHRLCNQVDGPLHQRLLEIECQPPRWKRHAWRDAGMLVLSIDLLGDDNVSAAQRLPDVEAIVEAEIATAATDMPSEIEHNRARALAKRDVRNRRARFSDRALALGKHGMIAGDLLLADFELPRVEAVGVASVQRAALLLCDARTVVTTCQTDAKGPAETISQPTASPPTRRAAVPPAQRLGPTEALKLLAEYAHEAPISGVAEPLPNILTKLLGERLRVTVCRLPGAKLAAVCTSVYADPSWPPIMPALLATGSTARGPEQLADYLTYHGIRLTAYDEGARRGLSATGPPSRASQMVELQAELLRRPNLDADLLAAAREQLVQLDRDLRRDVPAYADALAREATMPRRTPDVDELDRFLRQLTADREPTTVVIAGQSCTQLPLEGFAEVFVVGNVDPQLVFRDVEEIWARFPSLEPAIPGRERQLEWPPKPQTISEKDPIEVSRILWAPGAPDRVELRAILAAYPPLACPDAAGLQAYAWEFGPPSEYSQVIDDRRAWRWRATANFNAPFDLLITASVTPDELATELETLLAHAQSTRFAGGQPWGTAARLARVSRITTCDSPARIVELLRRHLWTYPPLCPMDWVGQHRSAGGLTVVLAVVGGDERVGETLTRFGCVTQVDPSQ